jgi:surfactin synthase thioesterase subunit
VVIKENLLAWEQYAIGRRESQFFAGGHFYFRENQDSPLFPYLRSMLSTEIMPG